MNYNFTSALSKVLDDFPHSSSTGLQKDIGYGELLLQFIEDHRNENLEENFAKAKLFIEEVNYLHDLNKKFRKDDQIRIRTAFYFYEKYFLMLIYLNTKYIETINNIFLKVYNPLITKNVNSCYHYAQSNRIMEYDYEDLYSLVQTDFLSLLHEKFLPSLLKWKTPFSFWMKQHLFWLPFSQLQKIVKYRISKKDLHSHYTTNQQTAVKSVKRDNTYLNYLSLLRKFTRNNVCINCIKDVQSDDFLQNALIIFKYIEGRSISDIKKQLCLDNTRIYTLNKMLTNQIKDRALDLFN